MFIAGQYSIKDESLKRYLSSANLMYIGRCIIVIVEE